MSRNETIIPQDLVMSEVIEGPKFYMSTFNKIRIKGSRFLFERLGMRNTICLILTQ